MERREPVRPRRALARVWSDVKRDFGFAPRQPDFLDALDARLRLQGYHPVIRCVVVGLGLAASYVIFYIFFVTIEIQNLVYLLWLGGLLHQVVNRPRGVPVQWTRLLVAAAIPAINLFGQWHERIRKEREVESAKIGGVNASPPDKRRRRARRRETPHS